MTPNSPSRIVGDCRDAKKTDQTTENKDIPQEKLSALRNGDHDAFRYIYLHYRKSMTDFLFMLLRNREDAEEITQDIFTMLWENRSSIDGIKSFRSYLYTSARNRAFKLLEHKKVINKYNDFKVNMTIDYGDSPDEIVVSKETAVLISIALEHMPSQQRRVFEMSRFDGKSDDEIAESLSISKRTVQTHLYKARKEIRELLYLFLLLFIG